MRFSKLALERYGHFDGCELSFPTGSTDLHVIYGPNEAGKSTSLAAVSDLLFGFPTRSPYNFRFDYSLLRVGAVLEDDGSLLACRRRKSGTTLIDGADRRGTLSGFRSAWIRMRCDVVAAPWWMPRTTWDRRCLLPAPD